MRRIPWSEIEFLPQSFADPNSRLFRWQGQLYRGITPAIADLYRQLFANGLIENLAAKRLLVETQLTDLELEGYAVVLWHRTLPFVSYPYEWCGTMLKDAARMVINLELELAAHQLTLQDAHVWNVLFDGPCPVWVDFGSITSAPSDSEWSPYEEFRRFFMRPLFLIEQGRGRTARWLLHDFEQGVLESDLSAPSLGLPGQRGANRILFKTREYLRKPWLVRRYLPDGLKKFIKKGRQYDGIKLAQSQMVHRSRQNFLLNLRQKVDAIVLPSPKTEWSNYYDGKFPDITVPSTWAPKHLAVGRILDATQPASVLDVGSNRGWFAQLATRYTKQVVAFDSDEVCVAQMYQDAKEKKLPLLPLMMNFKNPSPGYGLGNRWLLPALARFRCDMVFALALVHHLVFKQRLNFDQIAEALSAFSLQWLLVEFIPSDDRYVREWWSEDYAWYTLDKFVAALTRYFDEIQVLPSDPAPRQLLLCRKKSSFSNQ